MELDIEEKKILYAFGCDNYRNTVTRLKYLTVLTVDRGTKCRILELAKKMENERGNAEKWYSCFYYNLRIAMGGYFWVVRHLRIAEKSMDLKRRLADFSRKYPALCRLERSTVEGSVTYVLDKSQLSIRLVPPYSEERRAAAREYAKQHGFQIMKPEYDSA